MNWITNVKGACHLDYTMCVPEQHLMEVRQHIPVL
jgi:hypothetical protein